MMSVMVDGVGGHIVVPWWWLVGSGGCVGESREVKRGRTRIILCLSPSQNWLLFLYVVISSQNPQYSHFTWQYL